MPEKSSTFNEDHKHTDLKHSRFPEHKYMKKKKSPTHRNIKTNDNEKKKVLKANRKSPNWCGSVVWRVVS